MGKLSTRIAHAQMNIITLRNSIQGSRHAHTVFPMIIAEYSYIRHRLVLFISIIMVYSMSVVPHGNILFSV